MSRAGAIAGQARIGAGAVPDGRGCEGWWLAGPAAFLLAALILLPTLAGLGLAFFDWDLGSRAPRFAGLDNFRDLLTDGTFWAALGNTLAYTAVVLPLTLGLGLGLAILIENAASFRAGYRAIHLLPVLAAFPAMAMAWEALLSPSVGPLNAFLSALGLSPPNWLRDRDTVLPVIMVMGIWQHVGLAVILFIGGLKSISPELYDAAAMDGADRPLDRFFTVTLPGLGPVMVFVVTMIALRAIEMFDKPLVLTRGGPGNASETILHLLYVESFVYLRTGYGAALTIAFFVLALAFSYLRKLLDRRVQYG